MKVKIIFVILLAVVSSCLLDAQTGAWSEQTITPTPPPLTCVGTWTSFYSPPGYPAGWIGGTNGTILYTSDGGTNWYYRTSSQVGTNTINTIEAVNGTTGLLSFRSGNVSYILRSTNSGLNWQQVFATASFIRSIRMKWRNGERDSLGIAIGDPIGGRWAILRTSNAGAAWDSSGPFVAQSGGEISFNNSLEFASLFSPDRIFFGTNNSRIYSSTNFGATWSWASVPFQNIIAIASGQYLFNPAVYAGGNSAARSTDWGATWTLITLPGAGSVSTMTHATYGNTWYAKGSQIYRATNSGQNWVLEYTSPNGGNYTNMSIRTTTFESSLIAGWAVKDNGTVSRFYLMVGGIEKIGGGVPERFELYQNYPNPFNASTKIRFQAPLPPPEGGKQVVSLAVYDILGREIASILSSPWGRIGGATYEVTWEANGIPSGVYFYRLQVSDYGLQVEHEKTKSMVVLK